MISSFVTEIHRIAADEYAVVVEPGLLENVFVK